MIPLNVKKSVNDLKGLIFLQNKGIIIRKVGKGGELCQVVANFENRTLCF